MGLTGAAVPGQAGTSWSNCSNCRSCQWHPRRGEMTLAVVPTRGRSPLEDKRYRNNPSGNNCPATQTTPLLTAHSKGDEATLSVLPTRSRNPKTEEVLSRTKEMDVAGPAVAGQAGQATGTSWSNCPITNSSLGGKEMTPSVLPTCDRKLNIEEILLGKNYIYNRDGNRWSSCSDHCGCQTLEKEEEEMKLSVLPTCGRKLK